MDGEELRSVRVEVDGVEGGPQAPAAPAGEQRPRDAILLAFGGLLLLAALILAIRPAGDEAADGSIRTTPTTTTPTTTAATATTEALPAEDAQSDVAADVDESEQVHRRAEGVDGTSFSSVVRADGGYFAATWGWSDSQLLYRSVDGVEWTNVEAQFPDEFEQAIANQHLALAHLRRTADGFSLLAQTYPNSSDGDQRGSVSRLVSANGIEWEIQAEVALMLGESGGYPVLHTDSIWAYRVETADGSLLRELLATNLVDQEVLASTLPCWLDAQGDDAVLVYECGYSEPTRLTADDFIDGVNLGVLARCGDALHGLGTNEVSIIDTETGQELRRIVIPQNAQLGDQASTAGALMGVTFDYAIDDGVSSCDGLIDLPTAEHGPVMIWDSDSAEARNIALPVDRSAGQFAGWRQAYVRGDSMILIDSGRLWTLDLQSPEWSEATPLFGDRTVNGFSNHLISDDGNTVVSTGGNSDVYVTDMETATTRIIETGLSSGLDWIIYADDDIALIGVQSSVYRIDLRADDPLEPDEG